MIIILAYGLTEIVQTQTQKVKNMCYVNMRSHTSLFKESNKNDQVLKIRIIFQHGKEDNGTLFGAAVLFK